MPRSISRALHRDQYRATTGHTDVTFIAVSREIEINYERVCRASCVVYVYDCASMLLATVKIP